MRVELLVFYFFHPMNFNKFLNQSLTFCPFEPLITPDITYESLQRFFFTMKKEKMATSWFPKIDTFEIVGRVVWLQLIFLMDSSFFLWNYVESRAHQFPTWPVGWTLARHVSSKRIEQAKYPQQKFQIWIKLYIGTKMCYHLHQLQTSVHFIPSLHCFPVHLRQHYFLP